MCVNTVSLPNVSRYDDILLHLMCVCVCVCIYMYFMCPYLGCVCVLFVYIHTYVCKSQQRIHKN